MPMYHLAQINIARMLAPIDDLVMADFVAQLPAINALADSSPGFVWRLQTESGDATGIKVYDDDMIIINLTVWESVDALREFVYKSEHYGVLRDRKRWFEKFDGPYYALWWIPAGHLPDIEEGKERLECLRENGDTPYAFSFRNVFPEPAAPSLEELEKQNQQLKLLVELSVTLNSTLDLDTLLQLITGTATQLLDCAAASILLYDEKLERLYFAAATGSNPRKLAEIPVPINSSLAGTIFRTDKSIILNNVEQDPRHYSMVSDQVSVHVHSLVGVPMLIKDRVIGVLEGINKNGGDFTEAEESILSVAASHAAIAIHNAQLFRDAERRAQYLEAVRDINNAVLNSFDLQLTLPQILSQVQKRLEVDAADVLFLDTHLNALTFAAGLGFRTNAMSQVALGVNESVAGRVAREGKIITIPDLNTSSEVFTRASLLKGEDFISYHAAPLISEGQVIGVLEVFHRGPLDADRDWLAFFQGLAEQTAIAIDSATLFSDLERSNADLKLAYDATILGWSHALDLRDKETQGHTQRVTQGTIQLARAYGLDEESIVHIRRGALLHDMGKMGVPDSVLLKPNKLTDDEWRQMRQHPQYAYDMLAQIDYLAPALDIPYCHHEKWDGTGYPRGLKGEEIPLAARLFAVIDVWDALYFDRPYRKGWGMDKTLEYIREQSGKHFDPRVVEVFLRVAQDVVNDYSLPSSPEADSTT